MKNILILIMLFVTGICYGQISEVKQLPPRIKVGEINRGSNFVARLEYEIENGDTTYILMYKDDRYSSLIELESVTFSSTDNTVGKLYQLFKSVFTESNRNNDQYKVQFTLGTQDVIISNYIVLKKPSAFFHAEGFFALWEKEVDKLFGK